MRDMRKPSDKHRLQVKSFPEIVDLFHSRARRVARTRAHRGRKLAPGILLQCLVLELTDRSDGDLERLVDRYLPLYERVEDSPTPLEIGRDGGTPPRDNPGSVEGWSPVDGAAAGPTAADRQPCGEDPKRGRRRRREGNHV